MLFSKKAQEHISMAILGIVAVLAVVGLVLLFTKGPAVGRQAGDDFEFDSGGRIPIPLACVLPDGNTCSVEPWEDRAADVGACLSAGGRIEGPLPEGGLPIRCSLLDGRRPRPRPLPLV